ncbi:MAG: efflux RND transporter permease subunit, partial [Planctomycetota bacterium]
VDPESRDFISWLHMFCTDPEVDIRTLQDFAERRIQPLLESIPGVSAVNVVGGREAEAQVQVDPVLLAQRGITLRQFVDALRQNNENASAGQLPDGKYDVRLRAIGRFDSVDDVLKTIIVQTDAGPVFVSDVADVVETHKESTGFVYGNGEPMIAMNVQRQVGSNEIEIISELDRILADINGPNGLLANYVRAEGISGELMLFKSVDRTQYIEQALDLVTGNLLIGAALAVIVLLIFLRSFRSIGIIAIAIPISVLGSVVVLILLGRSINIISLAGIAFAVGMVVDNAIVVLENIYRHLEMGKTRLQACRDGAKEVSGAVLAATLTTVIVFLPIIFIEEAAGQLFRDIAIAICAAVAISLLVSITVIPSAAALLLKGASATDSEAGTSSASQDAANAKDERRAQVSTGSAKSGRGSNNSTLNPANAFASLIQWLNGGIVRRIVVVIAFTAITGVGIYSLVPEMDYLPQGNRNVVFGILTPPPGYSVEQMREVGTRMVDRVRPYWEAGEGYGLFNEEGVEEFRSVGGSGTRSPDTLAPVPAGRGPNAGMIVPPALDRYLVIARGGRFFHIGIANDPNRAVDAVHILNHAAADELTPGIRAFAFQSPIFRVAGSTGSALKVDFQGLDYEEINQAARAVQGRLMGEFGPRSVRADPSNFDLATPEVQLLPDKMRLTDLGLTVRDLALAMQVFGDGAVIGDYEIRGEIKDLRVIAKGAAQAPSLIGLIDKPIATPDGAVVTVGSVARLIETAEVDQIKRVQRQRAVTLEFTPPAGMPLDAAINAVNTTIVDLREAGAIAPGVNARLAGSAGKLANIKNALLGDGSVLGTLQSSMFLALLIVYLLMCVLFQSWIYPMVILITVPLANLGGFLALRIVHEYSKNDPYMPVQNLDVLTLLGFLILMGVVVNNAILIVHQTLNFKRGNSDPGTVNENTGIAADNATGLPARQAITEAVRTRVRPILMSTCTSVGGMLPLVTAGTIPWLPLPEAGSELYRGLGAVVVGGLLVGTIFTLVLVPVVLSFVVRDTPETVPAEQPAPGPKTSKADRPNQDKPTPEKPDSNKRGADAPSKAGHRQPTIVPVPSARNASPGAAGAAGS